MSETVLQRRARLLGENVPTFYTEPLHLVRGEGVWLQDVKGRKYLDAYNNVAHVGHGRPEVAEAIHRQQRQLNVNTRYVVSGVLDYVDRLQQLLAPGLDQVLLCCTGTEANDVAIRMAEAVTGKTGIVATDNTYHGNSKATAALSSRRPPIGGLPSNVRLVPAPDGVNPLGGSLAAQPYVLAKEIQKAAASLEAAGHGFAGFMFCPIFANEGLQVQKPGALDTVVAEVRKAGGLLLCDEVQAGFGRVGTHWWGHEALAVEPDVVTMGKPMGNGYPVAGVVARKEVMGAFRRAFGYFNTFGGNPVAAAAGMATLDVLERDDLIGSGRRTGYYLLSRLKDIDHPAIAQVRGAGLFLAVELIQDGANARQLAHRIVNDMRRRGVLIGAGGRDDHILKIRPPMPFNRGNADLLLTNLEEVFAETLR